MENNRIVIDTNVIISASIQSKGFSGRILNELVATGEFEMYLSSEVYAEYVEKPQKASFRKEKFLEKYPHFHAAADVYLDMISQIANWVTPTQTITKIKDDSDNRFLELALEADAFCIITGNSKDFDFGEYEGIKIFSPRDFYEWWEENQ